MLFVGILITSTIYTSNSVHFVYFYLYDILLVLILVLVGYHDKYALYCFVVTVFLHSKRIKAYSMFFMFIFFKCLLIMTDCCFLFYLTKRENNISCTINLYKKSRNAGATNLKTNTKIHIFLRKNKRNWLRCTEYQ